MKISVKYNRFHYSDYNSWEHGHMIFSESVEFDIIRIEIKSQFHEL